MIQVHAETDTENTNQKYGRTYRSAMGDIDLTAHGDWVYFINDSEQLERRHVMEGTKEIVYDGWLTDVNIVDGYVYGYLWQEEDENKGIYRVKLEDKSIERISNHTYVYNMMVVGDWIYFKKSHEKGILRIKLDGTGQEEVYKGHVNNFIVNKDSIYLIVGGVIAHIGTGGDNFYRFEEDYFYWYFTLAHNKLYATGDKDDNTYLVELTLDGKKTEVIYKDMPMLYSDIDVYGDYVYFDDSDGNMLRSALEEYKPEMLFETGLLYQYNIVDNALLFELSTKHVSEVWRVNLDTMTEKRMVPKHNSQYEDIKAIMKEANALNKDVKKKTVNMTLEKVYLKNKEKITMESKLVVDKVKEQVAFNMVTGETTFDYWIMDQDNMIMELSLYEDQYFHFYGEEIKAKYQQMMESDFSGAENGFSLARGATLKSTSTQHILRLESNGSGFSQLINQDFMMTDEQVALDANMDTFIYVNKKTGVVDRAKLKTKAKDDDGTYVMTMEIKVAYDKASIRIPTYSHEVIKQKNTSMGYIDLANKALEKEEYDKASKYGEKAIKDYAFIKEGYLVQGKAAYAEKDLERAEELLSTYYTYFMDKSYIEAEVYEMLAECYYDMKNYDGVIQCVSAIEEKDIKLSERLNLITGWSYVYTDDEYTAEDYFNAVLKKKSRHKEAIIGLLSCYVFEGYYEDAIDLANEHEKFLSKQRSYWYLRGVAYGSTHEIDLALEYTIKALEYDQETYSYISDNFVHAYIAEAYCTKENYNLAEKHMIKIKNKEELEYITDWKDSIKEKIKYGRLPINEKISQFIADHYLYKKHVVDFDKKINDFADQKNVTEEDVETFINTITKEDDPFTWLIQGDEFDKLIGGEDIEDVIYKVLDEEREYLKITSFLPDTGNNAVKIIRKMENTKNKDLIIDLRGNGGGAINAAVTLLDELLGNCTSVYLVDREGETFEATSDYYYVNFRRIFVLLDEESASSSEIVALSLKKFGENVTLVGRKSYGKGVAQNVLIDSNNKTALYVVSNYWNSLERNIDGVGIEPDVPVEGKELEDYLTVIKNIKFEQ